MGLRLSFRGWDDIKSKQHYVNFFFLILKWQFAPAAPKKEKKEIETRHTYTPPVNWFQCFLHLTTASL